jgi:hypothetical protein
MTRDASAKEEEVLVVSGSGFGASIDAGSGTDSGRREGSRLGDDRDHQPGLNLATFGMCKSMQNPAVQNATAAAQGVLTPVPCVPLTTSPWSPGADGGDLAGRPLLTDGDELRCAFGGTIKVDQPVATSEIA